MGSRTASLKAFDRSSHKGLPISRPGDRHEVEAGRLAAWVTQTPAPKATACCRPQYLAPGVEKDILSLRGGGKPLAGETRTFFEPRFGHDFSRVRIHTDSRAENAVETVRAGAFTLGQDIFFRNDTFAPETVAGRHLLAHELVHTMQQSSAGQEQIACGDDIWIFNEFERQLEEEQAKPRYRVNAPASTDWVGIEPIVNAIESFLFSAQGPQELVHFTNVREDFSDDDGRIRVTILEGRYALSQAYMDKNDLVGETEPDARATMKVEFDKETEGDGSVYGKFWYGSKGPVNIVTSSKNPVPQGTHEIEIPDYEHPKGAKYGEHATTWFRIGHSGDRYLHPGMISAGCLTVTDTQQWPDIWNYLIRARHGGRSVGVVEVKGPGEKRTYTYEEPTPYQHGWTSIY